MTESAVGVANGHVQEESGGNKREEFLATAPIEQLLKEFGSDVEKGMTSQAAEERLKQDGLNELKKVPLPGFVMLFFLQLLNFVIILLFGAAFASIIVGATS